MSDKSSLWHHGPPKRSKRRSDLFWKQLEQASKDVAAWPDYLKRALASRPSCICKPGAWNPNCPVHPPTKIT